VIKIAKPAIFDQA